MPVKLLPHQLLKIVTRLTPNWFPYHNCPVHINSTVGSNHTVHHVAQYNEAAILFVAITTAIKRYLAANHSPEQVFFPLIFHVQV